MNETARETREKSGNKKKWLLPPCASYDVDGMESWLSGMAEKGWLLEQDGFFAGFASFKQCEPRAVRYRLEAAPKSTSLFTDDGGAPDPEAVALAEACHWEYAGKRGEFYIYRTFEPGARELNTDPAVQALAVAAAEKRQWGSIWPTLFWLALYIGLHAWQGGVLLSIVQTGSWYFLFSTVVLLCLIGSELAEVLSLRRLKRSLREGAARTPAKPRRPAVYYAKTLGMLALCAAYVCVSLHLWSAAVMDEDKISLDEYTETLPFATLTDLAGEGAHGYRTTMGGISFNFVTTHSDPLAPVNIEYAEHARVTRADGTVLDGALYVEYHEAANEWIARRLALGLVRRDKYRAKEHFEEFSLPAEAAASADFATAYRTQFHWPVLVIQKGTVVKRVMFYTTSPDEEGELLRDVLVDCAQMR